MELESLGHEGCERSESRSCKISLIFIACIDQTALGGCVFESETKPFEVLQLFGFSCEEKN